MRSQATKPIPKKGALSKTTFKACSAPKQAKKKSVSPKKVKNLVNKSLVKSPKKNNSKDDVSNAKKDGESLEDKSDNSSENSKTGLLKANPGRSDSPTKKSKKESKEKKDASKNAAEISTKTMASKKAVKSPKKVKTAVKANSKKDEMDNDDIKYKINSDTVKKFASKFSKVKTVIKKGNTLGHKNKVKNSIKHDDRGKEENESKDLSEKNKNDNKTFSTENENQKVMESKEELIKFIDNRKEDIKVEEKVECKTNSSVNLIGSPTLSSTNHTDMPKVETERPLKFFTSNRSPRTVDIDVKCCKNSKGNLSVSERFLSMKCESKTDDNSKEKNIINTLVSQGPEIDVYTFTEKVDSPKSILSDFRNPINKNIGRVRPIARVKGTIIDKKTDSDKKKYSPHRPIEEVVKQLKANKRSEEISDYLGKSDDATSSVNLDIIDEKKDIEDAPKAIVSKSYKMVARKSSITGKPFSPIKFLDIESPSNNTEKTEKTNKTSNNATTAKKASKPKKQQKKSTSSDDEFNSSKFSLNTKSRSYSSSDESVSESNDDHDSKESSESDVPKTMKTKNKKYKRITDIARKTTSKELKELSKDSLVDLKDESLLLGNEKPSKRRLKLLSMWTGPKKHRMASLNAIAKVHCLYENESRTHMELGLMKTIDRQVVPGTSKPTVSKRKESKVTKEIEKQESTSESEYENKNEKKEDSSESSDDIPPQRTLRGVPGIRSAGKYWDPKSSTSSSEDSELESKRKSTNTEKKKSPKVSSGKSDSEKPPAKMKKTVGVPVKKKRNRNEVIMDLKDMVVQKRMASLNATAILAASYEKRSSKSSKDDTTSDSCSDESFIQKPKNGVSSGVKSEAKTEETLNTKQEDDESPLTDRKQKVEVIVNQDTDVTITGVYSTHHHEGFCTVSGMQYRISSTSHTQTTATANCEKEGCSREEGTRYTPLTALSSMQPPAEHSHSNPHPVPELGGLARRAAGCSSAFSTPSPAAHHEPGKPCACSLCDTMPLMSSYGYYQPAGPLIKESGAEAERTLARYHPPPHYHAPHPPVLQQYGPPYYPAELCYGRYYRPPGPYHMPPPQPDPQVVGVGNEPYPPPQYYGAPPCYQHSPQRIPYVEYRGCPCPLNACPKNVLIGPATGKAPTGGGPADTPSAIAPPGGAFRAKVRACALDAVADTHGSGKDPPLEPEPPAAADAPHPCLLPAIGSASPKRELFDVRDNLRLAGDMSGPVEAVGPPSPARGSAGACAPQPPPIAPRRARLGKAMARRTLTGDDTGLLLATPQPPAPQNTDADDDVMAISPPICAPIDLSSSDERSTPLVDVKKENDGPTYASPRKTDAQALREHNSTTALADTVDCTNATKAVKRRYSKPKLEIDMKDVHLEDSCKTNGIGEHVKLQKRRKVSSDQTDAMRTETVTKEPKKRTQKPKKVPKMPATEKKTVKRKLENAITSGPKAKKMLIEVCNEEDPRHRNVVALPEEPTVNKTKTKSALLLDNLLRKNSIDRTDANSYGSDTEINPAKLFLPSNENIVQNCVKKKLNLNNNIVENSIPINGVRPNTIAAMTQLLGKKLASKNACKIEKVDSNVTHHKQTVLKAPTDKSNSKDCKTLKKREKNFENKCVNPSIEKSDIKSVKDRCETPKDNHKYTNASENKNSVLANSILKRPKVTKTPKIKITCKSETKIQVINSNKTNESQETPKEVDRTDCDATDRLRDNVESVADKIKEKLLVKRCKLQVNGEMKGKKVEKVAKLLVSKKLAIKADEVSLVVEDACASPTPSVPKGKTRRRRSGTLLTKRARRTPAPVTPPSPEPRATLRWSNGWKWDGEFSISKVYLNNDSRLDFMARCWSRMTHDSGDQVARGDCVLLRAAQTRAQPYVARIARLWENPEDGEMMISIVWYYRPEHTDHGRQPTDAPDEVFASRHREANSVACIEDKCYVLTFNEYCRYRKRLKATEEGVTIQPSIVPPMPASEITPAIATNDSKLPPSVSPELVLFCRKVYDFRSKKIQMPNK